MEICSVAFEDGRLLTVGGVPWPHEPLAYLVQYTKNGRQKSQLFEARFRAASRGFHKTQGGVWVPLGPLYPDSHLQFADTALTPLTMG